MKIKIFKNKKFLKIIKINVVKIYVYKKTHFLKLL